jgi:hypothetical protein
VITLPAMTRYKTVPITSLSVYFLLFNSRKGSGKILRFDRPVGPKRFTNLQSFSTYSFGIVLLMMIKGQEEQREREEKNFRDL